MILAPWRLYDLQFFSKNLYYLLTDIWQIPSLFSVNILSKATSGTSLEINKQLISSSYLLPHINAPG